MGRIGFKVIYHFTSSITDTVHKLKAPQHRLEGLLKVSLHQIQQVKSLKYQADQSQHPQRHLLRKRSEKVTGIRKVLVNSTGILYEKHLICA